MNNQLYFYENIQFNKIFLHRHIKHDLKEQYHVDVDEKANSKELEYYNFKLHDYDDNGFLDGLELLVALNHDADHVPAKSEVGAAAIRWTANAIATLTVRLNCLSFSP